MDITQYNVSIVVEVPNVGATESEVEEWIQFNVGYSADIGLANPLHGYDMDTNWIEIDGY